MSTLTGLQCPECGEEFEADVVQTVCESCDSPLFARYDLAQTARALSRERVSARPAGLWRWAELLPVRDPGKRFTLGEGDTPLLPLRRIGERLGLKRLYVKDEGVNPTGTFKARGMAVALSRAIELGTEEAVTPTAGNAGGALANYAARAGIPAHIYMPRDAPASNQAEVLAAGSDLQLVEGTIEDAGREAAAEASSRGWTNFSTFREPYRVEGKKTMGLELADDFGWELPEVVIYPTGGGTGLVGMWKAFEELEELGWVDSRRPRMVSVQSEACAPIVDAMRSGADRVVAAKSNPTRAPGLRVAKPYADRLILRAIRESGGSAVAVSEEQIAASEAELARAEGIFACPEGAATLAGLEKLVQSGEVEPDERVVLFNTGTGLKYLS
ncbi:MAG: threonine synthase [Chloroflexi bacterium]|nr:threonine synthase [Chloroflexota bacterium]MDK1044326.1 threonine synthase [Anaerolineales bacterium]MCH8875545.1 threonine synthase [Chloroflexota bacterium]MCI0773195.1 threonine synthase [Chloroflexota bacterium]MCI0806800.1 threonine synthase [Chloroflexota bacterium]